jgi:IS5 family transposase
MLGKKKQRQENLFSPLCSHVSDRQALLRTINSLIDFTPFRVKAAPYFGDTGRPSIDPIVMIKMMFLGYLFDIRSDRKLVDECADRISHREFISYGPDENIPTHANFTRWRQLLGPQTFKEFLYEILSQCEKGGMKLGNCRLFDSTRVQARAATASNAKVELELESQPDEYLDAFIWQTDHDEPTEDSRYGEKLVVSTNDPEARLLRHSNEPSRFVHKVHAEVDSKTGLVVDIAVSHKTEHEMMIEFLKKESRPVECVGADKGYSTADCYKDLLSMGITPFIPVFDHANDKGKKYHLSDFIYQPETDSYICPAGKELRYAYITRRNQTAYIAAESDCQSCPLRDKCLNKGKRRTLTVSEDRWLIEMMKQQNRLPKYIRVMQRRKTVMEGTWAHAKEWLGMSRARGVGRASMEIQASLVAVTINVKKLLGHLGDTQKSASGTLFALINLLLGVTKASMKAKIAHIRREVVKVRLSWRPQEATLLRV